MQFDLELVSDVKFVWGWLRFLRHSPHLISERALLVLQQFVPALRLRIRGVFDLEPAVPVVLVYSQIVFRHDAFQIMRTDLLEESLAGAFDVLGVDNALAVATLGGSPANLP